MSPVGAVIETEIFKTISTKAVVIDSPVEAVR
jgi:hypothetical protein